MAVALLMASTRWRLVSAVPCCGFRMRNTHTLGEFTSRLRGLCVGGAVALLWARVPRADKFVPPGPRTHEGRFTETVQRHR